MQSILTNAFIATIGRALSVLLGVVTLALLTRYLGPAEYGAYVLILSFGAVIQLLADLGLYLTLSSQIAQGQQDSSRVTIEVVSLRVLLLLAAFVVSLIIVWFVPSLRRVSIAYWIIFFGLAAQSLSQLFMAVFQYYQAVWRATVGDLLGRIAQIICVYVLGYYLVSVSSMAVAFTIGTIIALSVHYWLLPIRPAIKSDCWRSWPGLLSRSWPLGAMLLLNAVYFRIDMVVLSLFRPGAELGWYGAAYRIVESVLFFPAMLGGLLLPRLGQALAKKNLGEVRQYISEGFTILYPSALLGLLLLVLFNKNIILLVAGAEYNQAAPILSVLSLALAVMFLGNLFGFVLVAMQRQFALLQLYGWLVFFNLLLNLIFVPRYGAMAAAVITVLTEGVAMSVAAWLVIKDLSWPVPYQFIGKGAGISLFSYLVFVVLPDAVHVWLQAAAVLFVFTAMAWLIGVWPKAGLVRLRTVSSHDL